MNPDILQQYFRRVPFLPVISCLPTGETVAVCDPKLTTVSPNGRTLVIAQGERLIPINIATIELAIGLAD